MSPPIEVRFQQEDGLYWLIDGQHRAGFRPSGEASFGDEITLIDSFQDPAGSWFWLNQAPADRSAFAGKLSHWMARSIRPGQKALLWIDDVAKPDTSWVVHRVTMKTNPSDADLSLKGWGPSFPKDVPWPPGHDPLNSDKDPWDPGRPLPPPDQVPEDPGQLPLADQAQVLSGTIFSLSGVRVQVSRQSWVLVDPNRAAGFIVVGLSLNVEGTSFYPAGDCVIGYEPGRLGCLTFELGLPYLLHYQRTSLEALGVSMRFFAAEQGNSPLVPNSAEPEGPVRTLRVAVLKQRSELKLYASFDPLAPFDPMRTRLSLFPDDEPFGGSGPPPSFDSPYTTTRGYPITLTAFSAAGARKPGFVLAAAPTVTGEQGGMAYYFTPDGDFLLGANGTGSDLQLLCGLTGVEYIRLPRQGSVLHFRPGGAAYMGATPTRLASFTENDGQDGPSPLCPLGTTAWIWVSAPSPNTPRYHAQSEDAVFYSDQGIGDDYLSYQTVSSISLSSGERAPAFPMLGYMGLAAQDVAFARDLERQAIAPERHRQIGAVTSELSRHPPTFPQETITAISPTGLAIGYAGEDLPWAWVAIGNTESGQQPPNLRFTAVDGPFKRAISSAQLFMVLGNADLVMEHASVRYQLTAESLALIGALPDQGGISNEVLDQVSAQVSAEGYRVYDTERQFNAMLTAADAAMSDENRLLFQRYGGLLTPVINDWQFRLSPRNWAGPRRQTRLLFKFVSDRCLAELVRDTAAWNWPEAAVSERDESLAQVSAEILDIILTARAAKLKSRLAGQTSPYDRFLATVDDPRWTGVLALSAEAPLDSLPEALQPLAVGIEAGAFYCHHLALTTTGFANGDHGLQLDVTSTFGLIDYDDAIDQYFDSDTPFAFKVQRLTVGFENGQLASFSSSAQLMVNRLFGAETRLEPTEHGNNLLLEGYYQAERTADAGAGNYVFAMSRPGYLLLSLGQLRSVAVDSTRLVVARSSDPGAGETNVTAVFELAGRLRFAQTEADFDPFCWGPAKASKEALYELPSEAEGAEPAAELAGQRGLPFANYAITMTFSQADPADVHFSVSAENLTLDPRPSTPRAGSLAACFPIRLVGLLATPDPLLDDAGGGQPELEMEKDELQAGRLPEDLGFVSISAPLQQGRLSMPWYGLVYELDLGSMGALAGSLGLSVRLLAAWSPGGGEHQPAVYLGAALPGVEDALGAELPLQGILDVGFRSVQFSTYRDDADSVAYLLRLRDFGLRVLGLSFPPGHNDITLFANPDPAANTKLGWYAAYDSGKDMQAAATSAHSAAQARRIRQARPPRTHASTQEEA